MDPHTSQSNILPSSSDAQYVYYRPADATEVAGAYECALSSRGSPSVLALSRQNLPCLESSSAAGVAKGAYTIYNPAEGTPKVILAASGSEVPLCIDVAQSLGVPAAVVSVPCLDLLNVQDDAYKKSIFPQGVPVLSVEAAATFGWARYAHAHVGVDKFGKSAKGADVYAYFGFTKENVASKAKSLMAWFESRTVPWLVDAPQI